ncbi:MAG: ubiquinol-cytochrome c reductase iron-sulfur subunit [Comamonadaceae bacterium CG1_02_60_18]|nr:MAG: ubiquinol-cytochrome c reductase iron-sulfur subunit [Comamonadaceae bacterium CG1_02_60_18]PIQ50683.1 MAG: ubiquinol-cytochrome c reductase iron-sulfur subunit [Comamonadaceae bacterium CG12_big_fil_rev_8_21_14_0_65_59_15]
MTSGPIQKQPSQRRTLVLAGLGVAASAGAASIWPWTGSKAYPQGDPMSVDLSDLPEGKLLTVNWQDRPVWVLRRSESDLALLTQKDHLLTDVSSQESVQPPACRNPQRSLTPEVFVAIALCTHRGCTPYHMAGKGFMCPCHASQFDLAGRVFDDGPAPANLVIPAYHFAAPNQLVLGEDA